MSRAIARCSMSDSVWTGAFGFRIHGFPDDSPRPLPVPTGSAGAFGGGGFAGLDEG